jgi:subtilisin family serine protease
VGLALEEAREQSFHEQVVQGVQLLTPYLGTDVVFGLVDVGMDFRHNTFKDADGNSRVIGAWLQAGITKQNSYGYGSIFDQGQMNNLTFDIRDESHSTHVAGIGAGRGNGLGSRYMGVAPDADIISVSNAALPGSFQSTGQSTVADGVDFIFDRADNLDKPAVANLSLASNIGPHDGEAIFDLAINDLQGLGKIVVTASGNDGGTPLHIGRSILPNDTIRTFVNQNNTFRIGFIDIWAEAKQDICIRLGIAGSNGVISWDNVLYCTSNPVTTNGRINNWFDYNVVTVEKEFNGKSRIFIRSEDTGADVLCIEVTSPTGADVHLWNCGAGGSRGEEFVSRNYPGFIQGDDRFIIGEIGGNNPNIITAGAYTSSYNFQDSEGNFRQIANTTDNFRLAAFSSRGPNVNGVIKPDLTAPGNIIISSINDSDINYSSRGNLEDYLVVEGSDSNFNSPYAAQSGTSMSSPMVAGAVVLMLEANPYLSNTEAIEILKETAYTDVYTGQLPVGGNNFWGSGKLNIFGAVQRAEALFIRSNPNSSIKILSNPISDETLRLAFEDNTVGQYEITLYDTSGRLVQSWERELVASESPIIELGLQTVSTGYYIVVVSNPFNSITSPIIIY